MTFKENYLRALLANSYTYRTSCLKRSCCWGYSAAHNEMLLIPTELSRCKPHFRFESVLRTSFPIIFFALTSIFWYFEGVFLLQRLQQPQISISRLMQPLFFIYTVTATKVIIYSVTITSFFFNSVTGIKFDTNSVTKTNFFINSVVIIRIRKSSRGARFQPVARKK